MTRLSLILLLLLGCTGEAQLMEGDEPAFRWDQCVDNECFVFEDSDMEPLEGGWLKIDKIPPTLVLGSDDHGTFYIMPCTVGEVQLFGAVPNDWDMQVAPSFTEGVNRYRIETLECGEEYEIEKPREPPVVEDQSSLH